MSFAIQSARLFALSLGLTALLGASAIPAMSDISAASVVLGTSGISAGPSVSATSGASTAPTASATSDASAKPAVSTTSSISATIPAIPALKGCFKTGANGTQEDVWPFIRDYCLYQTDSAPKCITSSAGLRWRIQTCHSSAPDPYYVGCFTRFANIFSSCSEPPAWVSRGGWEIVDGCETVIDPNVGSCEKDEHP